MSHTLTVFDIPLLRERGFEASDTGASYFATDKDDTDWQAWSDDEADSNKMWFRVTGGGTTELTRSQLDDWFPYKESAY